MSIEKSRINSRSVLFLRRIEDQEEVRPISLTPELITTLQAMEYGYKAKTSRDASKTVNEDQREWEQRRMQIYLLKTILLLIPIPEEMQGDERNTLLDRRVIIGNSFIEGNYLPLGRAFESQLLKTGLPTYERRILAENFPYEPPSLLYYQDRFGSAFIDSLRLFIDSYLHAQRNPDFKI